MIALLASTVLAGAAVAAHGIFAPRSRLFCPVLFRGDAGPPPRVALTFDDGPCPGATDRILDILAREEVPAAFFVIGAHARRWPGLVRRIADAGHIVGNHSDTHAHFGAARRRRYWLAELDRASDAVAAAIGRRPALFRPPMGHKNWHLAGAARRRGCTVITWGLSARDGLPTTPERIVHRLVAGAGPGRIMLLHDGVDPHRPRDPWPTVEALPAVIRGLRARGLAFERLDRLIGAEPYQAASRVMARIEPAPQAAAARG